MRMRSRAQSNKNVPQGQSQTVANGEIEQSNHVNEDEGTNDTNNDISDQFNYLPMGMLDMQADLNIELDSSLQPDTHPALTSRYGPAEPESRGHDIHTNQRRYSQSQAHLRSVEQAVQTRWCDIPSQGTSDDLCDFSLPLTMHSSFPSTYPRHHVSPARNITDQNTREGQDGIMVDFDQSRANLKSSDSNDPSTDSGYGNELSPSDLLRSPYGDGDDPSFEMQAHKQDQEELSNATSGTHPSNMTSWIRKLSDTNMLLHNHMHSIPSVEARHRARSGSENSLSSSEVETRLPVDSTFKLSAQYTGLLTSICTRLEAARSCNDPQTVAQLTLDQSSQLLVLSGYMCLLETYDKILQHIKAWLDVRLKLGVKGTATVGDDESNFSFPLQLPSLAVGSFKIPKTSAIQSIVLTCVLETNILHMHSLISEVMRPACNSITGSASQATLSGNSVGERRKLNGSVDGGDGLSSVAKVTLQAIEANEDSTLRLVHLVSKLAHQRVML
ncbi:hypothetical protein N7457_000103 [Penicillium paradoxum]|uniref:uncharacterized protein n=1 Tax=Penicillium paradoxum TaxID=176176 RepID=UPI002548AEEE|nr:uncharacterized protein N7457_000103 [Penicillium paradoxum]KAJ5793504.1 hypothetical protein N7457_000103 [Penicillium paradoxum]